MIPIPRSGGAAPPRAALVPFAATAALLAGCSTLAPDAGFDRVAALTRARTGETPVYAPRDADAAARRERLDALLRAPLTADAAVRVAFLANRGLQARFGELGVADAERVQAGRLANPTLGFGRITGGGLAEIDRSIGLDLAGLLTLPLATRLAERRVEAAQLRAAGDAVRLAADVRRAYFDAVAAAALERQAERAVDAAGAASELARRMADAGTLNRLDRLRQQAFAADAATRLARGRLRAEATRERLARRLGLAGAPAFVLPEHLPDLPEAPLPAADAMATAAAERLDLLRARLDVDATAQALGLTRATRFVDVVELSGRDERRTGEPRERGAAIELRLPLFDFGDARVARAEAVYGQSLDRAAQRAIDAESEVREAHAAYRRAREIAAHDRDEVVPLRRGIAEENLRRYNGMLIDVFALLADAGEQLAAADAAIESLRDFWLAATDLQTALTGGSPAAQDDEAAR